MLGGSTTWSSTLTRIMSSMRMLGRSHSRAPLPGAVVGSPGVVAAHLGEVPAVDPLHRNPQEHTVAPVEPALPAVREPRGHLAHPAADAAVLLRLRRLHPGDLLGVLDRLAAALDPDPAQLEVAVAGLDDCTHPSVPRDVAVLQALPACVHVQGLSQLPEPHRVR